MLIDKNRRARVVALQVLYSHDLNPVQESPDAMVRERVKNDVDQIRYAHWLIEGVTIQQKEIDAKIECVLQNWRFARLAETDKNVLRIGVFELMNAQESVGILMNEAIEIAKEYGDQKSGAFVNGVLDKIRKNLASENLLRAVPVQGKDAASNEKQAD